MNNKQEMRLLEEENNKLRHELEETWIGAPEYRTIEMFVQFCKDDERKEYSHEDLIALNTRLGMRTNDIRKCLSRFGLALVKRDIVKHIRGFTTSSNDRFYGPGSAATHGGSGFDNKE